MGFAPGTTLIHPVHGLSVVSGEEERQIGGEVREYLVLDLPQHRMQVHVPLGDEEEQGLRAAVSPERTHEVLELLAQDAERPHKTWTRALKKNRDRARSGRLRQVAIALRELAVKRRNRGTLSPSEQRLERNVKRMVVSEVAASLACELDHARKQVEDALEQADFVAA